MSRVDHGSSLYNFEASSASTLNETSSFHPLESEKGVVTNGVHEMDPEPQYQTSLARRRMKLRRPLTWAGVGLYFLAIIVGIAVTGTSFKIAITKDVHKHGLKRNLAQAEHWSTPVFYPNKDPNSPILNVIVNLNDFDWDRPAIEYDIYANLLVANETSTNLTYVCVQIFDLGSPQLPITLAINEPGRTSQLGMNTASTWSNISTDGMLAHYPFDTYYGALGIIAISPFNSSVSCWDDFLDDSKGTVIPSQYAFGQNINGFGSHNRAKYPAKTGSMDDGAVVLTFVVKRHRIIQFFAVIMFFATWLLTAGILMATAQIIVSEGNKTARFDLVAAGTALLFALPSLRSAQPGIPDIPTLYDVIGYFWNVALLSLSTFGLICHSIYRLQVDSPPGSEKKNA